MGTMARPLARTVGSGRSVAPPRALPNPSERPPWFESSAAGDDCEIGPFSRLRPGTVLSGHVKVGNFVEMKNSHIAPHSKVNHLTYVGDATVGTGVNVGAGTITCNYDGANKHRTVIGDNAFIGSGVMLVAPVEIGAGASVWYACVVRGDVHHVRIGARTNVQDGSVLHVTKDRFACLLGDEVTVGHRAVVHGCRVGDGALIGIGAIVLDGAVIGREALVGAGAVVTPAILEQAAAQGLNPRTYLDRHDGFGFFAALDGLIVTGPTQTNVNDFRAILVS